MDGQKRQPLNQLLTSLTPGLMVDSAWLRAQGISRTSIHDYVRRGWLERVAPRVYRRATPNGAAAGLRWDMAVMSRSEEHTSELQSLMRISYAVFCLKKKNKNYTRTALP